MATITEDHVSFETAQLIKKKGFEQVGCQKQYNTQGDLCVGYCYGPVAPTLQMAMKWLRIEHNIHIEPHIVRTERSYGYMPNYIDLKELKPHFPFDEFDFSNADKYACITYDKACETTIKYCLENLI